MIFNLPSAAFYSLFWALCHAAILYFATFKLHFQCIPESIAPVPSQYGLPGNCWEVFCKDSPDHGENIKALGPLLVIEAYCENKTSELTLQRVSVCNSIHHSKTLGREITGLKRPPPQKKQPYLYGLKAYIS